MTEPSLIGRQRSLLRDLAALAAETARVEPALATSYQSEIDRAEREYGDGCTLVTRKRARTLEAIDEELRKSREAIERRHAAEQEAAQKEYARAKWELGTRLDTDKEAAETAFQEAMWTAEAVFEGARSDAETKHREDTARLGERVEEMEALREEARRLLQEWRQPAEELEEAVAADAQTPDRMRKMADCIQQAERRLEQLRGLKVPRLARGLPFVGMTLLVWLALIYPIGWTAARFLESNDADRRLDPGLAHVLGLGLAGSTLGSLILGVMAYGGLRSLARRQVEALYTPFCQALLDAQATREYLVKLYQEEHQQAQLAAQERFEKDKTKASSRHQQKLADVAQRRATDFEPIEERYRGRREASTARRGTDLRAAEQRHTQARAQAEQEYQTAQEQLEGKYRARLDRIHHRHLQEWQSAVERWQQTLAAARDGFAAINLEVEELFPAWEAPRWNDWQPPAPRPDLIPPAMRFGAYTVPARSVVTAPPWEQSRPAAEPITFRLPALAAFPEPSSILLHTQDEGRDAAVESLRTVMFRLLTTLPPGRVRFTIIDPVGLGQNFASFMNLADHDEALVGSRIWTEGPHIEQRLADLTAHMENVIQKYLRNRYATISEYNQHAGEVAEPYRILVVANFPINFTAEAVRRLVSIAQSGPRCGVSTLISIDGRQPLPKGFDLGDLERCGVNLVLEGEKVRWRDEDFERFPLSLDRLPDDEFCNRILKQVGQGARDAQRVEVPFEFIAPPPEAWWAGSTAKGISVPLGRAGATRRQHLELGKGTSQHALVAGKTGSGKSTLLHALITNLALLYSPDEVELYLVDFKKGVEFKTYALHELPHARVIAIESEREFGLSVLMRLDTELRNRGERFRAVSAQDLNGFRQAVPGERMPRVLLIVDEFQEFFVEDDRIAQEASRLLDRLVRQGRAFGMHVLLGSQTLGGAYSLARSTIDQMAVRIALQCSEADAHLILSDDNAAARLLSRPGEAIYNDANGLVEGNDPFQVVWLGDDTRERYLATVQTLVRERPTKPRSPTVIFEGNADADVRKNQPLERLLTSSAERDDESGERVEVAWLGEAMAIDELTAATFRRQNGSNLLIIGQQPEAALGMLTVGLLSLAAHVSPGTSGPTPAMPRFLVVDGHQGDPPRSGVLARLPELLEGVGTGNVPAVRVTGSRDLPAVLTELTAELERRQSSPGGKASSIYLVLYGLQRMRDLRRQEDDFSFMSKSDGPPSPDRQLGALLREGAALGIHTLIWCDTMNNLQRAFDRSALREIAMRVVFQMNVADSSNLIDSPAASKLGLHRALFANEEDGRLDKFRPYGVPPEEWLKWVREQFHRRTELATR